ncbi:DUF397 domain-containing protein [Streptomyces sp. NPDC089799]|uniref:DUF397 domain-containing protein n=1 Tax=Streptomyces sp. NPDC089799 TaxID=3155066 RepID=UPI00341AFEED
MHPHDWQKSSYCAQGDSCVGVAIGPGAGVRVTQTGAAARAVITVGPAAWTAFLRSAGSRRGPAVPQAAVRGRE